MQTALTGQVAVQPAQVPKSGIVHVSHVGIPVLSAAPTSEGGPTSLDAPSETDASPPGVPSMTGASSATAVSDGVIVSSVAVSGITEPSAARYATKPLEK